MTEIDNLFFELIRVAIGTQESLSRLPKAREWGELYEMAKKQSLIGVCFAGIQRLGADADEGFALIGMSEMQYLTWMGMAAKIQRKNETVDRQCVALQKRLAADGFKSCILKGQGVGQLYAEHLLGLRQSGDIDVWVQNKSIDELVDYVNESGVTYKATAAHVECDMLEETDVELHSEPAFLRCFWNNKKLRTWFHENKNQVYKNELGIAVPTNVFNLVYMMVHMYHHVLFEGLGLRQVMDYYFVMKHDMDLNDRLHQERRISLRKTFQDLGILNFAEGMLWVIMQVFSCDNLSIDLKPNEKVGRLLLDEIMTGGNFGHHDEKNKNLHGGTAVGRSLNGLKRNMKFFALGPWEVLCSPLWSTWHYFWRKRRGLLN